MILIYILSTCLIGLALAYILNARKGKATQLNLEVQVSTLTNDLARHQQQSEEDATVHREKVRQLEADLANRAQQIMNFKLKYEPLLDIEAAVNQKEVELSKLSDDLLSLNHKFQSGKEHLSKLQREVATYEDDLEVMSFGLYKPRHDYATPEEFRARLDANYQQQKAYVKDGKAAICHQVWSVNGNAAEGRKMTKLNIKNMLYAFNGECDALVAKVKWNNATKSIERLQNSFAAINKLGIVNSIEVTRDYYDLKLAELTLTHEYENKKQEEKEEQRRIREQMREEEKVLKDIERAKREADEEERRYQKALLHAEEDLKYASHEDVEGLTNKVADLEAKLKEAEEKRQRAISMAEQTKAGHIYVISNIGSFGEDVYKIGMTRRLEPLDRIRELSDASVPFRYDVHAVIFSENAPALEHELHKRFHEQRLNKVNGRKEFFKVTLDDIEAIVKEHTDAEIEFTKLAEAQEYRETMSMIEALLKSIEEQPSKVEQAYPDSLL